MKIARTQARGYLILLALFFIGLTYSSLADEEQVGLSGSDQSVESYQVGAIVFKPEPTITEPHVNLHPVGFKEYMYDTGIWYGVQWGARFYWVRDKTTKFSTHHSLDDGIML